MGNMDVPEFQLSGEDEIAGLSRALGRMKRSLIKAMKMLEV
jgi:HAMP domain-containing protein